MQYPFAPVVFTEGYIPFNITQARRLNTNACWLYRCCQCCRNDFIFFPLCLKPNGSVGFSAAAYLFPVMLPISETSPLFRFIALLPIYHAQFVSLMSVEQMGSGLLYSIWAVPVAFALAVLSSVFSRKIFAKHQVNE